MSVVGIDFGNLNTVVAVARNRGIDVIVNEVSNRATPSLVSFGEKQRYIGEAAKTQEISNFKNTVSSLKRIIGRPFSDPDITTVEKQYVNCNLVNNETDGQVCASVTYENETREFTFTQLVASYFTKVKEFTQNEINSPVTDVVISVPGWFTDHQRRAIQDAAEIAHLNCIRTMNDLTAAALGYGITKLDLPDQLADPNVKPKLVCFVDFGHSSFQVSIVSFVKGKLIVKGAAYDRNLGGRSFDDLLVEHFTKEFSAKYKLDLPSSKKAMFRLRLGCERVKKVLSANAVTLLNIECLMDDTDVSAEIRRADFEEWIKPLVARVAAPLQQAIKLAGVSIKDIDAVELIGGSTRIPAVKEALSKFFGGDSENNILSTTLNQDEAIAKGCALQCAIASPVFKVRDFSINDWNGYPVQFNWDAAIVPTTKNGKPGEHVMDAFPLNNLIPSAKLLTLQRVLDEKELAANGGSVDFKISADYTDDIFKYGAPAGHGKHIGTWTLKGIKKVALKEGESIEEGSNPKATIKIKAKLDGNGIVSIESAHQIEDVTITYTEEPVKKSTEEIESPVTEETKDKKKNPAKAAKESAAALPVTKTKKVQRKTDLDIVAVTSGATSALKSKFQQEEGSMYASDRLVIDTAEKRNALEEYVYEARTKLEMAWTEFISDDIKSTFMEKLNEMENWLYTIEGEEATKSVYAAKLESLKTIGDPVALRARESELRPLSEKAFREYANGVMVGLTSSDDRYDHIDKADLEKVRKECLAKLDWLNASIANQNEQPKYGNLSLTSDEINKAKDSLTYFVTPILNKPKPKVEPKEEPKAEPKKEEVVDDSKSEETMKDEEMNEFSKKDIVDGAEKEIAMEID